MYPLHELLAELKQYQWVDLSHVVHDQIPFYHTFSPLQEKVISSMERDQVYSLEYTIGSSHGTHIDAPSHFAEGKHDLLDIPQKERVLPLYVLRLEDKVAADSGYAVTVADIQAFEAEYGEIPAGSFVALSNGWYKRFHDSDVFKNADEDGVEHTPGWSIPALEYLSRTRQVVAIGGCPTRLSVATFPLPLGES